MVPDATVHAIGDPVVVPASGNVVVVDGDDGQDSLLANPDFGSPAAWVAGGGWVIANGVASHAAGSISRLDQALPALAGVQRFAVTVSNRSKGTVTPILTGASEIAGSVISTNGTVFQSIDTSAGISLSGLALEASADFDGSIDTVILFSETPTCTSAGSYDYYVAPISGSLVTGKAVGPFNTLIV